MEFTSIAVGVFAIVGTLFFLFGREMTRRILGYLLSGLVALAAGCAWAAFLFQYAWGHSLWQGMIQVLGVTGVWLAMGSSSLWLLWEAVINARREKLKDFVIALAAAACVLTNTALEIGSTPVVPKSNLPAGYVIDQPGNVFDQFDPPNHIPGNPSWATNKTPCTTDGPKVLRENAEAAGVCHN
jgi:hypothetical protein